MVGYSRDISAAARDKGGRVLAKMRHDAGVTVPQVMEALDLSKQAVSAIECGKMPLRVVYIEKLAKLYGVPIRTLALDVLKHRDPMLYVMLFGDEGDEELRKWVDEVEERGPERF